MEGFRNALRQDELHQIVFWTKVTQNGPSLNEVDALFQSKIDLHQFRLELDQFYFE